MRLRPSSTAISKTTSAPLRSKNGKIEIIDSTQIPHIVRRTSDRRWASPGASPRHQAVYRRRIRPTSRTSCTSRSVPGSASRSAAVWSSWIRREKHVRFQPCAPRRKDPSDFLGPPGRQFCRPQSGAVFQSGCLRLPRPFHCRQRLHRHIRSCTPADTYQADGYTVYHQHGRLPAPCAATAFRRSASRWNAIWTTSPMR